MLGKILFRIKYKIRRRRVVRRRRFVGATSRKHYLEHKEKARELVQARVEFYNNIYGFKYNKIFIKNQRTRWGSCSSNKNLNFNYKIVLLSPEQQDYIIVHELCHLEEFNHSRDFWSLVEKTVPNHETIKAELRTYKISI